ncbi:MAG TPA: histidine phosphatase family protein [Methylomirabilota bacterium]|nr:histidine phosphatase family protein [Methylomirabilota bacterium]
MSALVWFAAVLALWAPAAHADDVWEAMRAPGSVIVVRHAYAPGAFDPPDARLDDCSTQRNLDENGKAQAKRMGEAFRAHGVTVGKVLSSPRCRCLDTARLAFKEPEPWGLLQGARPNTEALRTSVAAIRKAMVEHRAGPPLVLVTHGFVISDLTGLDVRMGAFVVMKRGADGTHTVAGQLYVE